MIQRATNYARVQAKLDRQHEIFRDAVEWAALNPPSWTSEELARGGEVLIDLWNEGAARIEAMGYSFPVRLEHHGALGLGFKNPDHFPFTLALAILLVLIEHSGDQAFKIMRDLLLSIEIPLSDIKHHADAPDGLWRTRWRKDKIGQAARLVVSEAWVERENEMILDANKRHEFCKEVERNRAELQRQIRLDRDMGNDSRLRNSHGLGGIQARLDSWQG